jgi:hypothetical protein
LPVARITDKETGTYTDFTYGKESGSTTNSASIIYSSRKDGVSVGDSSKKGGAFKNFGVIGDFTKKQGGKDPSIYSDFDQINVASGKTPWSMLLSSFPQLKQRIKPGMVTSGEMNIGYNSFPFNSLRSLKMQVSKWVNRNGLKAFLDYSQANLGYNEKNGILSGTSSGELFSIGGLRTTMLTRKDKNYLNDSRVGFSAEGHVPNFANPLSDAINREKAAGVPVNQIRVDAHSALVKKENPLGLGVTNTRDEPNGLRDVFGADSYVPNYAISDKIGPLTASSYASEMGEVKDSLLQLGTAIKEHYKIVKSNKEPLEIAKAKEKQLKEEKERVEKLKTSNKNRKKLQRIEADLATQSQKVSDLTKQSANAERNIVDTKTKIRAKKEQQLKLENSIGGAINRAGNSAAGKFSKKLGGMFSGDKGMMMMMGAPMAAGFLQEGGPGGGAGGAAYAAGGALTGASSGAMMASMVAPLAGPFAPLVTALGAATGGLIGLLGATDENAEAMRKSSLEFDKQRSKTTIQSAVSGFNAVKNDIFKKGQKDFEGNDIDYRMTSAKTFNVNTPTRLNASGKFVATGPRVVNGMKAQEEVELVFNTEEMQSIISDLDLDIQTHRGMLGMGSAIRPTTVQLDKYAGDETIDGAIEFAHKLKGLKDYGNIDEFRKDPHKDPELEELVDRIARHSEKGAQYVLDSLIKGGKILNEELTSAAKEDMVRVQEMTAERNDQLKTMGLTDLNKNYSMNEIIAQFGGSGFFDNQDDGKKVSMAQELYEDYLDLLPDTKEVSYKKQDGSKETKNVGDLKTELKALNAAGNEAEIIAILKSAGIEVGKLLENYTKQNNAVIIRLNLEQAMIRNAQLMFDEQMKIKRVYGSITDSLSNYERVMAGSMNKETKAKIAAAKAQVKLSQKYEEQLKKNEQTSVDELLKIAQGSNNLKSAIKINLAQDGGKPEKDVTDIEVNDALNAEFEKGADEFLKFLRTLTDASSNEGKALSNYEKNSALRNKQLIEGSKLDQNRLTIQSKINVELGKIADDASATAIKFKTAMDNLQHAASIRDIGYQRDQDNFQRPIADGKKRGLYRTKQEELDFYEKNTLPKQQADRITSFNQSTSTTAQKALNDMGLAGYYNEKDLESLQTEDVNSFSELGKEGTSSSFEELAKTAKEERTQKRLNELNTGLGVAGYTIEDGNEGGAISRLKTIVDDNTESIKLTKPDQDLSEDDKKSNQALESANALLAEQIEKLEEIKELKSKGGNLSDEEQQALSAAKSDLDNISERTKETLQSDKERLATLRQIDAFQRGSGAGYMVDGFRNAAKELRDQADYMDFKLGGDIAQNFASGMADAMQVAINGAEDLDDQLRQIGLNFLMAIQRAMLQSFANRIVGSMGFNTGGRVKERHNGGVIRTYTRGGKAFQTDQTIARYNDGGGVRKYSSGGMVPAMVSDGEYVMNRGAVSKYGTAFMHNLNSGIGIQQFAEGGDVGSHVSAGMKDTGKKYRKRNVSGFFLSGAAGNVALADDARDTQDEYNESMQKWREDQQKRYEKKAKKRALIGSLVSTVVMAGLNNAFDSISDTGTGKLTGAAKEAGLTNKSLENLGKDAVVAQNIDGSYKIFKNGITDDAISQGFIQSSPIANNKSFLQQANPFRGVFGGNKSQWNYSGSDYFQQQLNQPKTNFKYAMDWGSVYSQSLGGMIHNYNKGGHVSGKKGIDQIPAMLSDGEYVIKASSARKIGKANLDMVNAGKYYQGGAVGSSDDSGAFSDSKSSSANTNNINITVNVDSSGKSSSEKESKSASSGNEDVAKYKEMSERIKQQVVSVIVEEKRPGGVLSESR